MAKYCARPDLGASADPYFAKIKPPALKEAAARLRAIVRAGAPKATEAIKWGMPVYEHCGMLCYIRAQSAYIAFGFYDQGTRLSDPDGLLEGSGRAMRHVKVRAPGDIREGLFKSWVKRAAALNAGS